MAGDRRLACLIGKLSRLRMQNTAQEALGECVAVQLNHEQEC